MKQINPEALTRNPFQMIGKDWLLITAKKEDKVNTMTASWGGVGIMWGKPAIYLVIRPSRYTKEFVDSTERFSVSVLNDSYRKTLSYFGTVSGRDEDKIGKSGLVLAEEENVPYFEAAEIAMICKKLYVQPMDRKYLLETPVEARWYPNEDWHHLYIAEVEKMLVKE